MQSSLMGLPFPGAPFFGHTGGPLLPAMFPLPPTRMGPLPPISAPSLTAPNPAAFAFDQQMRAAMAAVQSGLQYPCPPLFMGPEMQAQLMQQHQQRALAMMATALASQQNAGLVAEAAEKNRSASESPQSSKGSQK